MGLRMRNHRSAEFNMSSLTDIIFLLLIFFLLTSSIVTPKVLEVMLPGTAKKSEQPRQTMEIEVTGQGSFVVDGSPMSISAVSNQIRSKVAGNSNAAVIIYADKTAPYEKVVEVLDVAKTMRVPTALTSKK